MKKIFVLATVIVSTTILMLSIGANFLQAAEKMMDKEIMMKEADMTVKKGQMRIDKGQMMMDKGKMMMKARWTRAR